MILLTIRKNIWKAGQYFSFFGAFTAKENESENYWREGDRQQ